MDWNKKNNRQRGLFRHQLGVPNYFGFRYFSLTMGFPSLALKIVCLVGFCFLANVPTVWAQDADKQKYIGTAFEERTSKNDSWDRVTNGLDYSKKRKKKKEEPQETNTSTNDNNLGRGSLFDGNWAGVFKILFFVVVIGLLVFLTLRLMGGTAFLSNKKIDKDNIEYSIEKVEADIHKSDLEGFARHALDKQDYKLAIRLYYLQIIKVLSQNKTIKWKRDKTNNAYVNEMRGTEYFREFRNLTRSFERVWYGDSDIQSNDFNKIRPRFLDFLEKINAK